MYLSYLHWIGKHLLTYLYTKTGCSSSPTLVQCFAASWRQRDPSSAALDIAEVPVVEVLQGVAVHLMCAAPKLGDHHARPLRSNAR